MLYKKNSSPELSKELFKNPTSEYRGTPFWAWNSNLEADELCRQIDIFKEMGLGGFHMHVRTGLENEYMSDEYMELVKTCVDKAKKEEMLAWLYDEDRWPSGAAGGIVTKNHALRQTRLCFTHDLEKNLREYKERAGDSFEDGDIRLLTCYDIVLSDDGYLVSYKQISEDAEAEGEKWYAVMSRKEKDAWHNDEAYVDTLNPSAIKRFIEVTHDKYAEKVGDEFDKTVPAIFTDEPQVARKGVLQNSHDTDKNVYIPWTDRFAAEYKKHYGADVFEYLPEVIWELPPEKHSPHRYYYHDLVSELFADAFADTIGNWCFGHNISLTGHMMEEPTLRSQTAAISEAMRSYRGFGIPGIDMLCDNNELTTAKQCQSAVHQFDREAMLSELYGVTGWDADFRIYKNGGDWQAALGVTVRVPHLSWYAMQGEAKRDYPASIHYHSPWYKEYHLVEDHFARVNTALTRGKPVVKVGVIHPIESYWLHWGPEDKTNLLRQPLDDRFKQVTSWLLHGSIDFDFISESLIPELVKNAGNPLKVGAMEYDAVIVPGCETLRSTTLDTLEKFAQAGGKLVFMGDAPTLADAVLSERGKALWEKNTHIEYSRSALLTALDENRTITIRQASGRLSDDFLYQLRRDGDSQWLFVCNAHEPHNKHIQEENSIVITVNGEYAVELWNTETGEIEKANVVYAHGNTEIHTLAYPYDSFLYKLTPGRGESREFIGKDRMEGAAAVGKPEAFEADEDNVLVLDIARWAVDDGELQPREEILRLDNKAREVIGIRHREGSIVQPWVIGKKPSYHTLTLRFDFESDIDYEGAELALEDADKAALEFNGEKFANDVVGWFVDKKILKVKLPKIKAGTNTLVVKIPLGESTNTEDMFILGHFGVKVLGQSAKITAYPEKIYFGDLAQQGFPFYGGNMSYKFKATSNGGKLKIRASYYYGAMLAVFVDGKRMGNIIYPPYTLEINGLADGEHEIVIKAFLNRYNTFGPLHLTNENESWHGPGAWRSTGVCWSYEYILRRIGLYTAPIIK